MDYLEKKGVFFASRERLELADNVLIGIPMDFTVSFRPGSRFAPARIRELSEEGMEDYSPILDRYLDDAGFYDAGDVVVPFGNVAISLERIQAAARSIFAQGKRLFAIGGEHLVSRPLIGACAEKYPDLCVVHFDAHTDLRCEFMGEEMSHACVIRYIAELLKPLSVFQLGIRSGLREEFAWAREHTRLYLNQLLEPLTEVKAAIGQRPVYVTLDIDVLDPAFAPGTGTPEAGGFSSRELLSALYELADLNVVGFDLVEVSPLCESNDNTSVLAAKILREAIIAFGSKKV
ncbi:MAG: agmatinase [Methylocystaceae bacterium]